jgi:hypothetical protein
MPELVQMPTLIHVY